VISNINPAANDTLRGGRIVKSVLGLVFGVPSWSLRRSYLNAVACPELLLRMGHEFFSNYL
jgi:hypothetical protein